jgi:HEAT repeat protein
MREEDSLGASEHMSPAMEALKEIGGDAAPALIEAIEAVNGKASTIANVQTLNREESEVSRRIAVFRTQARAAMVLGQIGDSRALSALERLLHQTDNKFIVPYVEEAIDEIKRRIGARNPV